MEEKKSGDLPTDEDVGPRGHRSSHSGLGPLKHSGRSIQAAHTRARFTTWAELLRCVGLCSSGGFSLVATWTPALTRTLKFAAAQFKFSAFFVLIRFWSIFNRRQSEAPSSTFIFQLNASLIHYFYIFSVFCSALWKIILLTFKHPVGKNRSKQNLHFKAL